MMTPAGYITVEHDGGTVHAIDEDDIPTTHYAITWWRVTPVCGTGTGVSSDEDGAMQDGESGVITCIHCIAILG